MVKVLPRRLAKWPAAAAVLRRAAVIVSGPRARPWLMDAGIAAVVTGVSLWGTAAMASWHHGPRLSIADLLLLVASGASLTARRRFPGTVLGVTLAAAAARGDRPTRLPRKRQRGRPRRSRAGPAGAGPHAPGPM